MQKKYPKALIEYLPLLLKISIQRCRGNWKVPSHGPKPTVLNFFWRIHLLSHINKNSLHTVHKDYKASILVGLATTFLYCMLVALLATFIYFLVRAQIFVWLPSIAGLSTVRESIDWIYQLLAIVVIGMIATFFGARFGKGSRWTGPLGLVLLCVAAISASLYLQVKHGIFLEIGLAIFLPVLLLIYVLLREILHQGQAMFIKELSLLHKDTLLKTVFENTFNSVFVVNEHNEIVYANSAALGLLGRENEYVVGLVVDELCPNFEAGSAARKISHYLRMAKREESQIGPHPTAIQRTDGTIMAIELTVGSVRLQRSDSPLEKRKRDRFLYVCNFWDATIRSGLQATRSTGYEDQVMANAPALSD